MAAGPFHQNDDYDDTLLSTTESRGVPDEPHCAASRRIRVLLDDGEARAANGHVRQGLSTDLSVQS